jgi:hypothetical protein
MVDAAGAPRAPEQVKMGVAADKISPSSVVQPKLCCSLRRRGLDDVRWSNPGWHAPIAGADREILDRLTAEPPLQQIDLPFHDSVPRASSRIWAFRGVAPPMAPARLPHGRRTATSRHSQAARRMWRYR